MVEFTAFEEKELECISCGHKEVCKYMKDVTMAWNAKNAIPRGKCIYWIPRKGE